MPIKHAMFDDFFWNSFLWLLVSFSHFTVSEKGFSHCLLCIPFYHCGVFPSMSPLSAFGSISFFTVVSSYPMLPARLSRWPDTNEKLLITTVYLLYILSFWYFIFCTGDHTYERSCFLDKNVHLSFSSWIFEILKISYFSQVKETWYKDLRALLYSVLHFGVENKKLVLA